MTGKIPVTRSVIERLNRSMKDAAFRREFTRAMLDLQDGGGCRMEPQAVAPATGNRAARRAAKRRDA